MATVPEGNAPMPLWVCPVLTRGSGALGPPKPTEASQGKTKRGMAWCESMRSRRPLSVGAVWGRRGFKGSEEWLEVKRYIGGSR